mmetsp:Transcript_30772/g.94306  ORF Transcript_30772/g.94306 Transcript_30772/m.94306 type:complete len:88 (+) Transcript_30772:166-429(+)
MEAEAPISYGDLRIRADREHGVCLFWVVPDIAPGFNVPEFYADAFGTPLNRNLKEAPGPISAHPQKQSAACASESASLIAGPERTGS